MDEELNLCDKCGEEMEVEFECEQCCTRVCEDCAGYVPYEGYHCPKHSK